MDTDDIGFHMDSDEDEEGEWGFCVQLEEDDGDKGQDHHHHHHIIPSSPKSGLKISVKQTVTRTLSSNSSDTSLATLPLNRIKSSSSFQELERAIGATLAMSFPESEKNNDISEHVKVINHINGVISQKAHLNKNLQQQWPIMRQRSGSETQRKEIDKIDLDSDYPMRSDLAPFIEENESRALIIFHSRDVIAFDIKSACQMFGSLYYFRSDFHTCGVTLLAYFDLRSAVDAKQKLSGRLGRLAKASVYSSIMLQPSVSHDECSLRVHKVLNSKSETFVQKVFSNYGPLRSIQRSFNDSGVKGTLTETPEDDTTCDYTAEYYNIQDAKLAAAEMNSSSQNALGCKVVFVPLEKRVERMKGALLGTLSAWRIKMANDQHILHNESTGKEGKQRDSKPEKLPIPSATLDNTKPRSSSPLEAVRSPQLEEMSSPQSQCSEQEVEVSSSNVLGYPEPTNYPPGPMHPMYMMGLDGGSPLFPPPFQANESDIGFSPSLYPPHDAVPPQMHMMPMTGYMPYSPNPRVPPHSFQRQRHYEAEHRNPHPQSMHGRSMYHASGFPGNGFYISSPPGSFENLMHAYSMNHGHRYQYHANIHHPRYHRGYDKKGRMNDNMMGKPHHHNGGHSKKNVSQYGRSNNEDYNQPVQPQELVDGSEHRTTVMIRNIPNKYSQGMLLEEINQKFEGLYDFFYLPIDFKNKCNVGYAFINFVDCHDVARFFDEFNDQRWRNFNSEKVCALSYARIQGKAAMIARFQNSSLLEKDSSYKPLLFVSHGERKGQPEEFAPGPRQRNSKLY